MIMIITFSSDAPAAALREIPYNNTNEIGDTVVMISTIGVVSTLELVNTFMTVTLLLIEWCSKLSTIDLNMKGTCTLMSFVASSRLVIVMMMVMIL